jgi:hypothetical protein
MGLQIVPHVTLNVAQLWEGMVSSKQVHGFPDGSQYVGEWRDGRPNGQGTHTFPDGEKFVGQFRDGRRHGRGTRIFPDGTKHTGEYVDGKFIGGGTTTFPNGAKHVSVYRDGKCIAESTYASSYGTSYAGQSKKVTITPWLGDPWIQFAVNMWAEFCKKHEETLPMHPRQAWNMVELGHFCFAFTVWAAQQKFIRKAAPTFGGRTEMYRTHVPSVFEDIVNEDAPQDEILSATFDIYLERETEYVFLLTKGAGSIFHVLGGSTFKLASHALVLHTCRHYVYSKDALVKVICPWLLEKGIEFKQEVQYE